MFQYKERIRTFPIILILTATLLTACNSQQGILVHAPWMMPAEQGDNAAVYFRLYNHTSDDDSLTSVSSDAADEVELDDSTLNGDLAEMTKVEAVLLPTLTEVTFSSGALQVTLLRLKQDLNFNDEIEITLHFQHYADLTIKVPVRNFPPPESGGHH